jgi:ankyrin repeat protein
MYFLKIDKHLCLEKDEKGDTMLTLASSLGFHFTVAILIKDYKMSVKEGGYRGRNCFLRAAENEKHETMRYLHKYIDKSLCNARDEDGNTALTLACFFGLEETVKLLIEELKIDINANATNGRNCFLSAVSGGNIEVMGYLHSVDKNLCKGKDDNGNTALHCAVEHGWFEVTRILVEEYNLDFKEMHLEFKDQRINCNDVKNNNGENAFHYAARHGKINHLKYFVEKDPEIVNSKTDMGWNALHFSVAYGTAECTKYLVKDLKFNIWERTDEGERASDLVGRCRKHDDPEKIQICSVLKNPWLL